MAESSSHGVLEKGKGVAKDQGEQEAWSRFNLLSLGIPSNVVRKLYMS